MHIRKVFGPRTVQLPDCGYLSRGDLPPPNTKRWVASRKSAVVKAACFSLISLEEAYGLYDFTQDDYSSWQKAVARHGKSAIRTTALKSYRKFYQWFTQIYFLYRYHQIELKSAYQSAPPQLSKNIMPVDIRQNQVQRNQIIVIEFG